MALNLALAVVASSMAVTSADVVSLQPGDGGGVYVEKNCVALGNVLMCDGAKNQCSVELDSFKVDAVEVDSFEAGAAKAPSGQWGIMAVGTGRV